MTAKAFRVISGGDELAGVLHLPAGRPCACVVACHGLGASKDGDKYLLLARELADAGLALARFDFRGHGESSGRRADTTIASRMADLEAVLEHLDAQPELDQRRGLLGSSLGGFVALWVASVSRASLPVVTWNAPADLREVPVGDHSGPGAALVAEVRAGRHATAPAGVSGVLVIQAERDEVVASDHARAVYDRCAQPKALDMIPGADHHLSDSIHRRHAIEASRRWLAHQLRSEVA